MCELMPRSQIKRAPDDFFQLCRLKDFRHFAQAVTNQTGTGRQFLGNAVRALFGTERHRAATGRTSGDDWTATGRPRKNTCRTSCRCPATVQSEWPYTIYAIICVQSFVENRRFN